MAGLKQDEWPADRERTTSWEQVHCKNRGSARFKDEKRHAVREQDRAAEEAAASTMRRDDGTHQGLPAVRRGRKGPKG